jgi:hypothetical protein
MRGSYAEIPDREKFGWQKAKRHGKDCYLPTPEEIRAECDALQAGWSPEELARRSEWAQPEARYEVPEVETPNLRPEIGDLA